MDLILIGILYLIMKKNKMKTCQCTNKVSGVYLYSNGPITGDGSANHIEVDEVEVFKFKVY